MFKNENTTSCKRICVDFLNDYVWLIRSLDNYKNYWIGRMPSEGKLNGKWRKERKLEGQWEKREDRKQGANLSHFAIRLAQVGMKKAAEDGNLSRRSSPALWHPPCCPANWLCYGADLDKDIFQVSDTTCCGARKFLSAKAQGKRKINHVIDHVIDV